MVTGNVWKYGDDVNTDVIYPGRYTYLLLSNEEMASHALEGLDPAFNKTAKSGDMIVGGWNWGIGSAREQAVKAIKYKGIQAIIAKSFARIYFRNCLNEGILAIACPEAVEAIQNGEEISIDLSTCMIHAQNGSFPFEKYPQYVQELVSAGGIIPFTLQKIKQK